MLWLPVDAIEHLAQFLDYKTFASVKVTSREIYELLNRPIYTQNASILTERICYRVFERRENLFISGPGGCGKTYTLNRICYWAKQYGRKYAITAPTGIAATNFPDGQTIHSFAGLGKGTKKLEMIIKDYEERRMIPHREYWQSIDLLLIDEISMVGSKMLEKLDMLARLARESFEPMGGIQLVFSGDFYQLPPIGDFNIFTSKIWNQLRMRTVEMTIPVRQSEDRQYFHLLSRIRMGKMTKDDIFLLKSRICPYNPSEIEPTRIYSNNNSVDEYNQLRFNQLTTPIEFSFHANDTVVEKITVNGKTSYQQTYRVSLADAREKAKSAIIHSCPNIAQFRQGALYILTINLRVSSRLVNGSRCIYVGEGKFQFADGQIVKLKPYPFSIPIGNNCYLNRHQYPLRLGYAVTIHSSQGMTLDSAIIDLGSSIRMCGQAYVALSRVRSLEGLYLTKFEEKSIKVSKHARKFYGHD